MGIFDDLFMPHSNNNGTGEVEHLVDEAISLYEQGNIPALQNKLYETYQHFNKRGGGRLITQYPAKDRLCEFFSFCLQFDWMHDDDIREVWVEDGFYCITAYLCNDAKTKQDLLAGCLDMFLILCYGRRNFLHKMQDILTKAEFKGESVFSEEDYANGADYVIRQFLFFSATVISPIERQHHIISPRIFPAFQEAKTDFEFASIPPNAILAKANFIAKIIEYILNTM